MSHPHLEAVVEQAAFRPHGKPWLLAQLHVALDELIAPHPGFEQATTRSLTDDAPKTVFVEGPSGAGKSSFVAATCAALPASHVAIRLPVSALGDPTDTGEALRLSLGTILDTARLDADERDELHIERTDVRTVTRMPTGITGARIGGGPIPSSIDVEVGSLREELSQRKLDGEHLQGVHRAVSILRAGGVTPIFVFDDTEAIVGGLEDAARVDGFISGPLRIFAQEIDAPCLTAIQTHLTRSAPYQRLAATARIVRIPHIGAQARDALARILERRLEVAGIDCPVADVVADEALDTLVQFYDDLGGDLRKTLAAADDAANDAASMRSERILPAHVRVGASNWR